MSNRRQRMSAGLISTKCHFSIPDNSPSFSGLEFEFSGPDLPIGFFSFSFWKDLFSGKSRTPLQTAAAVNLDAAA